MSNYLHTDIDFDINLWHDGGMRGFFSHSLIPPTALSVTQHLGRKFFRLYYQPLEPIPNDD